MLESPLPQWVRDQLQEMLDGYRATLPLIEARCEEIAASKRRDEDRKLCDDLGTVTDYRLDGKYCGGQVTRLRAIMEGRTPPDVWEGCDSREIPVDPKKLAMWAWQSPWENVQPTPEPEDAVKTLRLKEFMQGYTQREAHALILTEACGLKAWEAAREMGISERTVNALLLSARKRFGPNTTES